jgi:hypothetical protein
MAALAWWRRGAEPAAIALSAARLINIPAVRSHLEEQASKLVQGRVKWDTLQVRLLPSPRAVLRGVSIDIPGAVTGRAEGVEAQLRLLPLLVGRADVASVDLIRPVLQVHIAASTTAASAAPDPIVAYRSVMEEVATFTRLIAPNALVAVEDGTLDLYVEGIPPVDLKSLFVHVRTE